MANRRIRALALLGPALLAVTACSGRAASRPDDLATQARAGPVRAEDLAASDVTTFDPIGAPEGWTVVALERWGIRAALPSRWRTATVKDPDGLEWKLVLANGALQGEAYSIAILDVMVAKQPFQELSPEGEAFFRSVLVHP